MGQYATVAGIVGLLIGAACAVCDLVAVGLGITATELSALQTYQDAGACDAEATLVDGLATVLAYGGFGDDLRAALQEGGQGAHVAEIPGTEESEWAGRLLDGASAAYGLYGWLHQAGLVP